MWWCVIVWSKLVLVTLKPVILSVQVCLTSALAHMWSVFQRCITQKYRSTFSPLMKLIESNPTMKIHGNGNALFIHSTTSEDSYYLAVMHTISPETNQYTHFLYKFESAPPFKPIAVSHPLPLLGVHGDFSPANFANGIVMLGDKVLVTYGVNDQLSRVLIMSVSSVSDLFCFPVGLPVRV